MNRRDLLMADISLALAGAHVRPASSPGGSGFSREEQAPHPSRLKPLPQLRG